MGIILRTKDLTKKYDNKTVVDNLNLEINEGEIFGLLGPNGAGKSTTMNMITGFIEPTQGEIVINGYDILKKQAEEKGLTNDVEFYLEFFKYGCPPHGGFGIGIDRITMLLLGIPTIKESMFIFRGPNRLNP